MPVWGGAAGWWAGENEGGKDTAQDGIRGCGREGPVARSLCAHQPRGLTLREVHVKNGCHCYSRLTRC